MKPLVTKYTRKLYFIEKEDASQELNLSLIEAIYHIQRYDNEAMCLAYLEKSVINKYYSLCKKNIKFSQTNDEFAEISENIPYIDNFNFIELYIDLQELLKNKSSNYKKIIQFIIEDELSDSEISLKTNISRQYVNRVKKEFFNNYFDTQKSQL